jgi:hypothetical protein
MLTTVIYVRYAKVSLGYEMADPRISRDTPN